VVCDVAGRTQRSGSRNLVVLVVNGEIGMASQSNRAAASIGSGKPEIPYLGIGLFDPSFFRPEGRVFRGHSLNMHRTQSVCDTFYGLKSIWMRSLFIKSLRARLAFVLISKIYRQMYADTGIATDSARVSRSARWGRWLAKPCQRLFAGSPMPHLEIPGMWSATAGLEQTTSASD